MKNLTPFLNPIEWFKAWRFAKNSAKFDKSSFDLELFLYSKILTNNMLHFGYFEDSDVKSETISFKQLEDAQIKYAENIIEYIADTANPVLDVGCGMGGLSNMISKKELTVESLTPNKNQIEFINAHYQHLKTHRCKFEDFRAGKKFGTVINSESLQYISLNDAFENVDKLILPGGRWIIVDFFRLDDSGINKSSHLLEDLRQKIQIHNWKIVHERDITSNVVPTLRFANMYVERFLLPVKHFAYEKLRFKKPWLYYLTGRLRGSIENKIKKERAAIDPDLFIDEKRYMFFVLEKTSPDS